MKRKILITGGSGLLGSTVARIARKQFEVFATFHEHPVPIPGCEMAPLDITDGPQVMAAVEGIRPEIVVHSAALAKVDYCETHGREAWAANVEGAGNVARASHSIGAKLVHISTDSVFDGEKGMYREDDVARPLNIYASTKLEGEKRVQQYAPESIILRTAFYGWNLRPGASFAEWIINGLRGGNILKMFTDAFFTPVLADNLAEVLLEMASANLAGIFHVGGPERCSKFAFGKEIAAFFGFRPELVQPSTLVEAGLTARRARDISLDSSKVRKLIQTPILGIADGIKRFKELGEALYSCTK